MKQLLIFCYLLGISICSFCQINQSPDQLAIKRYGAHYDSTRKYREGFAAVCLHKKWGFINRKGIEVIAPQYLYASDFIEHNAIVFSGKWIMIDTLGMFVSDVPERKAQRYMEASATLQAPLKHLPIKTFRLNTASRPTASTPCPPNIDFEFGNFMNWYCYTGLVTTNGAGINTITMFNNNPPMNTPTPGRHTMITATTPSLLDFYGGFPINPPDGSGHAIRLGNDIVHDSAEKVRYIVQVPSNAPDFSVTFQYAAVLENPTGNSVHTPEQKPRMIVQVIDATTGSVIQCSDFLYVAAGTIPGFYNSAVDSNVKCKAWTPVFINLSPYAGQTLYLDFTTADCTLGAHFGYGYVDVGPCSQTIKVDYSCITPNITHLTGPVGFETYNWWNSNYTTMLGTGQVLTLNPGPALGTVFNLELIPFNGNSCRDTLHVPVTTSLPVANAGPDNRICLRDSITLGTAAVAGNTYQWNPPTYLSNASAAQPNASPPVSTTYTLTVTDANGCTATDAADIILKPTPTAGFGITNPDQCISQNSFSFQNNSTLTGDTYTSAWNFGDGNLSAAASPVHSYALPGTYTVQLIVTASQGCSDTTTHVVHVYEKPVVSFSISPAVQCFTGNSFTFQNNSSISTGALTYLWYFGDGSTSTTAIPTHSYAVAGTYPVKLIVTGPNGCKDSTVSTATIHPSPTAGFGITNPDQCISQNSFSFQNTTTLTGDTYTSAWNFGDGSLSAASSPVHSYALPGTYTVQLTVIGSLGCSDVTNHIVHVYEKPIVSFSVSPAVQCITGNSFTFQNNSSISTGALTYLWYFGDGSTSTTAIPTHSYAVAGTYPVKLIVTSPNGCKDSTGSTATVTPLPLVDFTVLPAVQCLNGNSFSFSDQSSLTGSNPVYLWDFGDGTTSNAISPVHVYTVAGNYPVKLTVTTSTGCMALITHPVTVNPKPGILFSVNSTDQCLQGNNVVTTNNSSVSPGTLLYSWDFGDGGTSVAPAPSHLYTQPGTYNIKLVATTDRGCKDSLIKPVNIHPNPTISTAANAAPTICRGNNSQLNATGGATYQWVPAQDLSCSNCPNPVASPTTNTMYIVTGFNSFGCTGTDTVRIKVIQPFVMRAADDTLCVGDTIRVSANGAANYSWSPATGLSSTSVANPLAYPVVNTIYTVIGNDGVVCFTDTVYVKVKAIPLPVISLGPDLLLATGEQHQIVPVVTNGPITYWLWTPSYGLSCSGCPSPILTVRNDDTYHVLVKDYFGCAARAVIHIKTFCSDAQVFIPDAFTPNGDGINDIFLVRAKGISTIRYLRIFNRWGELIFERDNFSPNIPAYGWDGKIKGVKGPPDVFVYTAEVLCDNGTSYIYKGNVSILK